MIERNLDKYGFPTGYTTKEPEWIGSMPVRGELEVLPQEGPCLADREWSEHGNNAVYIPNRGPLDKNWALAVGGSVLVRGKGGGWFMVDLQRDDQGYFVMCNNIRVPIVWNESRHVWVSNVRA